jgi:hypothetical protein
MASPQETKPNGAPGTRMGIDSIHKSTAQGPLRVLLVGPEGIGKTTFAADAPAPVFLGPEDGFGLLNPDRFPEPKSWADVVAALRTLETADHSFKTVVIDTLDWLEPLCWAAVCSEAAKASIESFDYGKGYTAALEKWRAFLSSLERIRRAKNMHVVLLAHTTIKKFSNPEGDDYDRYILALNERAGNLMRQWVDAVLFAQFRVVVEKGSGTKKAKAIGTPERVVHTVKRAAFDAKNRLELPETLSLSWEAFATYALNPRSSAQLVAEITNLAARAPGEVGPQTLAFMKSIERDRKRLVEVANRLRTIVEAHEEKQANEAATVTGEKEGIEQ